MEGCAICFCGAGIFSFWAIVSTGWPGRPWIWCLSLESTHLLAQHQSGGVFLRRRARLDVGMGMTASLLHGEYRNHPLCPVATPCVPCPVVLDVEKAAQSGNPHPAWVSCHSCHCCPNLIALRIRPDHTPPVEVRCRAAT